MSDRIVVNGMTLGKVKPLLPPVDLDKFAGTLMGALAREKEHFRLEAVHAEESFATRGAYEFHSPDLSDPLEVKWALLLPPRTAETKAIAAALAPLVKHRQGSVIYSPTPFHASPPEDWIREHYEVMDDYEPPYYVLLAGCPEDVPFRFQYLLDVNAAVGRLSFDRIEDYASYARKVVDFEVGVGNGVAQRAVVFATEHAKKEDNGATFLSRNFMTDPLVEMIQGKNIPVSYIAGEDATLPNLIEALKGKGNVLAPALIYTATHGLGVPGKDEKARRRLQGALVCQDYDGRKGVFSADKVPAAPFLHGSIVFTFACYGAGTPKQSDFFHWLRDPRLLSCRPSADIVAALPLRFLAHPSGPLAFFGHLDPSWVYSFADPKRVSDDKGWGSRMGPFRQAVDHILQGATVGYAVKRFNEAYALTSVGLANMEDQFRRDATRGEKPTWTRKLVDTWMTRNDMQNFIVLGDPAVKAKMQL